MRRVTEHSRSQVAYHTWSVSGLIDECLVSATKTMHSLLVTCVILSGVVARLDINAYVKKCRNNLENILASCCRRFTFIRGAFAINRKVCSSPFSKRKKPIKLIANLLPLQPNGQGHLSEFRHWLYKWRNRRLHCDDMCQFESLWRRSLPRSSFLSSSKYETFSQLLNPLSHKI